MPSPTFAFWYLVACQVFAVLVTLVSIAAHDFVVSKPAKHQSLLTKVVCLVLIGVGFWMMLALKPN